MDDEFYDEWKNSIMWKSDNFCLGSSEVSGITELNKLSDSDFINEIIKFIPLIIKLKDDHVFIYDVVNSIIAPLQYNKEIQESKYELLNEFRNLMWNNSVVIDGGEYILLEDIKTLNINLSKE